MSLANILQYIEAFTLILPLIEKLVTLIEGLFSRLGSGQGAAKKKVVSELAKGALVGAGLDLPDEAISLMIDTVVSIKNESGEFVSPASGVGPVLDTQGL